MCVCVCVCAGLMHACLGSATIICIKPMMSCNVNCNYAKSLEKALSGYRGTESFCGSTAKCVCAVLEILYP